MSKKIAVLGVGSIGQRHLRNLTDLGCSTYTHDPAIKGAGPKRDWIIDWADAVVIASPTANHWVDINDCRRAEKPCFVEKPIGHMPADITTSHVKMVGYNLRLHSCVKKAREWLGRGKIGQPVWANFTCAQFSDRYPRDGVILNWSHEIDLALYLLGKSDVISCAAIYDGNKEDIADICLRQVGGGCQIAIHLDYLTRPERRGFTIGSDEGVIEVDLVTRQASINYSNGTAEIFNGQDSFDENYLDEMRAFLMRLDGNPTIGCTAQEGLDVLDICMKAKEIAQ